MHKTLLTAMVCLGTFGAQAAAASADASVSVSGGTAIYFGDQNKGEILSAYTAAGYLHFEDDFQTLTAGNGCTTNGPHQVSCLIGQDIDEVHIHGFGGNDVVNAAGISGLPVKIWGDQGDDDLTGGTGLNELYGGDGNDKLTDAGYGSGFDILEGDAGNDTMIGSPGADKLVGGDGNDTYDGGAGADTMIDGGDGEDTVTYIHATSGVTVDPNSAAQGDGMAGENDIVGSDIEDIIGSYHDDTITGTDAANRIDGSFGNDTIDGRGGDDTIHGDDGSDTITGGAGRDLIYGDQGTDTLEGGDDNDVLIGGTEADLLQGDAGNDTLIGDDGADQLYGGDGNDYLEGGQGNDLIDGGAGSGDTAAYSERSTPVTATLGGTGGSAGESDTIDATNENLTGGKGSDTLTGDAGPNTIDGYSGGGNDTLDGAGGADVLIGRDGNDTLRSRDGAVDSDDCGDGTDSAQVDTADTATDCESVDRPVVAQDGGGAPPAPIPATPQVPQIPATPVKTAGPKLTIARTATRKGSTISVTVACPKHADAACTGTLVLRVGTAKVGAKRFSIKAGRTGHVKVTLSAGGRKLESRSAHRAPKVVAEATAHDHTSAAATTQRAITIHTAKRR